MATLMIEYGSVKKRKGRTFPQTMTRPNGQMLPFPNAKIQLILICKPIQRKIPMLVMAL